MIILIDIILYLIILILRKISMIIILFFLATYLAKIQPFQQKTFHQILTLQSIYLVYVHSNTNHMLYLYFNNFCQDKIICRELLVPIIHNQTTQPIYHQVYNFLNYKQTQYFFIIDASSYKKFILTADVVVNDHIITQFYQNYTDNILQPYYSSQLPPVNINKKCMQLTGQTYESFLFQPEPIKIVYLYTKNQNCEHCNQIFQAFLKLGEKYYKEEVIGFGYFDVMLNDSKYIKDQIMPYFLIYVGDIDEAMGYQPENLDQFQQIIKYLISEQQQKKEKIRKQILQEL